MLAAMAPGAPAKRRAALYCGDPRRWSAALDNAASLHCGATLGSGTSAGTLESYFYFIQRYQTGEYSEE